MKILGREFNFNFFNEKVVREREEETKERALIPFDQQLQRVRQDINTWRTAIRVAESVYNPNRRLLYQTYQDVVLDGHLSGVIDTRKNALLSKDFVIKNADDTVNEEKTKEINQQWFYDFVSYSLDSIFWGHSLIQFDDQTDEGFKGVSIIPRQFVRPETHEVIPIAAPVAGIDYTEEPYNDWLIGVGRPKDLGLLMKVAPYVLWKKNTIAAWSEHAEVFGMPIRIGKTNVRDEDTRKNLENMVQNLGSSAWAVVDNDDIVELIQSKGSGNAARIYDELIQLCNAEISKIIVGQTMTNDNGSSRSQAEVHERVLKNISEGDAHNIESVVNKQLIPFLNDHGMGYDGLKFEFDERDNLTLVEQKEIDLELLKYYNIKPDYFINKYGTPVEEKEVVESMPSKKGDIEDIEFTNSVAEKLKNLYS